MFIKRMNLYFHEKILGVKRPEFQQIRDFPKPRLVARLLAPAIEGKERV